MTKLSDLLLVDSISTSTPAKEAISPFFARYGLRQNPFPPNRTILADVLYNQDVAVTRFAQLFREILGPEPERRSMAVLAGTGGGKTHFLRYCRWNVDESLRSLERRFLFLEFQAGAGKIIDVARQILIAADSVFQKTEEHDFITALTQRADSVSIRELQQDDLRAALSTLTEAGKPGFKPKDRLEMYTVEVLRDVFRRWLSGGVLTQTERKYLGVISRISTGSMAVRVFSECLRLARSLDLFEGVVLFLDEIETVFLGSTSQYQAFLQDLRYLYDESVKNGKGYSLFILAASTTQGANTLRQVNYPVFQRLGLEADQRVDLVPISSVEEARRFANTYVEHERRKNPAKIRKAYPQLLSDEEIENAFQSALGSAASNSLVRVGRANQAPLLDALHLVVEQKRDQANRS